DGWPFAPSRSMSRNMSEKPQIAFLGLGVMGGPMAGHLLRAGYRVTAYNRAPARAEAWLARVGGDGTATLAPTPAEAARSADVVVSCVGNDEDLAAVMFGPDGALGALVPGALAIDHTTVSAMIARRLDDEARERGLLF